MKMNCDPILFSRVSLLKRSPTASLAERFLLFLSTFSPKRAYPEQFPDPNHLIMSHSDRYGLNAIYIKI